MVSNGISSQNNTEKRDGEGARWLMSLYTSALPAANAIILLNDTLNKMPGTYVWVCTSVYSEVSPSFRRLFTLIFIFSYCLHPFFTLLSHDLLRFKSSCRKWRIQQLGRLWTLLIRSLLLRQSAFWRTRTHPALLYHAFSNVTAVVAHPSQPNLLHRAQDTHIFITLN